MPTQETSPDRYLIQLYRADPLGEKPLRLCKRVSGIDAAKKQDKEFAVKAAEWASRRSLIKQAQDRGMEIGNPSIPNNSIGFADFVERIYLPWARNNLYPSTLTARSGTTVILVEDLANTPLADIENHADTLLAKWRAEGCRFSATQDRLGRQLNRKPRPISDAGINERLKILRAVLGHAHMKAKLLATRPRIQLVKIKRAAPGAGKPVRYFDENERVRFHRHSDADVIEVFEIGRMLGTRPGEMFHANVGWVDLKYKKVVVQATPCALCPNGTWLPKNGGHRAIDICPDLMPILRRLVKGKSDDRLLFDNNHGAPFSRLPGGNGRFARALRRAGLARKGLSIYSLRHTFAADLVTAGRPMQEVAALLGNSVRVCEMHYGHLMPGKTAQAVKALKAVQPWPRPMNRNVAVETPPTGTDLQNGADEEAA